MSTPSALEDLRDRVETPLRQPLGRAGRTLVAVLIVVALGGVVAWVLQLRTGLVVTGLSDQVSWGLYVANFVFFIGISMAGTLVSAVLRLTGAEWRRPITRLAEAITLAALLVAATMIVVDMGRPERLLNTILHPHLRSPILWDVISVSTYLAASAIYLYLPLIPDIAAIRTLFPATSLRGRLYGALSMRWMDAGEQRARLERAISIMAIAIIPIAISVHTVTAWIFGMTLREGWNSTIFGPYFVVGALYSGMAAIIVVLTITRRVYRLDAFITKKHLNSLGLLLLVFGLLYAYFSFAEYLTMGYKLREGDVALLHHLFSGPYAPVFWSIVIPGTAIPIMLLAFRRTRTPGWLVAVSILINIGMWLKRYIIVVPSLALPQMPRPWGVYRPSPIEWAITAASFAAFSLLLIGFSRLFPIVSVWEMREALEGHGHMTPTHITPERIEVHA